MIFYKTRFTCSILCGLSVFLSACDKDVSRSVDERLSTDDKTVLKPMPAPLASVVAVSSTYQASKDPFYSPIRSRMPPHDQSTAKTTRADQADKVAPPNQEDAQHIKQASPPKTTAPATPATKQTQHTPISPPSLTGKRVRIDESRMREPLEQYDLASLRYQGFIADDKRQYAIIMSPDGISHKVATGQYLGRRHGRVMAIDRQMVHIYEAYYDGTAYYQQQAGLSINH